MMRLKFILLVIALTVNTFAQAQTASQYAARGDKELFDGFPQSALFYYKLALKTDTNLVEAHFKMGESYRILRNYKKAADYYSNCASLDDQKQFPEAIYWQGMMLKQLGQYSLAKRSFQKFFETYRRRDDWYKSAKSEVESSDWALEHVSDPADFEVQNPDTGLNTIHSEMSPLLISENEMYFATMRYDSEKVKKNSPVYIQMKQAKRDSNGWKEVVLDLPISDETMHVGNGCFSPDSLRFYYTKCPNPSECAIYVIKKQNDQWGVAERLESPVNENGSASSQPAIASYDGKEYLFFASDQKTGKGGMDLWYVEIKNGNPLTRIRNLGNRVNTTGNEITPWFDASDTTFYFSSNQSLGFGGFDVYKSKGAPGSYNVIENAGTVVNSPQDDYYFTYSRADSLGYFASNRMTGLKKTDNETCCNDLYKVQKIKIVEEVPLDTLPIVVIDAPEAKPDTLVKPKTIEQLQNLLPISLYFHNDRPNPRTMATTTERDYAQTIVEYLALENEYQGAIALSNYPDSAKTRMTQKTNSFFASSLSGSIDRVNAALDVMLKELQDSAVIQIAVKGYASPLANSDYNLNLTYRRIDAMENYIRRYKQGAFIPFIDNPASAGGQLLIEKIPYGESKAKQGISDQRNDKVAAIYSPSAANERRIEILKVERMNSSK